MKVENNNFILEDMIIWIILINFFKKYYMNKKLQSLLLEKFSIISVIILILIYIYISIPNELLMQKGGAKTFKMPPNVPILYKYRFVFVFLPFLLLGLLAYYAYYTHVTIPSASLWTIGLDFFSRFQEQYINLVENDKSYKGNKLPSYKSKDPDTTDDNMLKFFNIIRLAGDPLSGLYIPAQYFCNVARPCGCCNNNNYLKHFFNCNSPDDCKNNTKYKQVCLPTYTPTKTPTKTPS